MKNINMSITAIILYIAIIIIIMSGAILGIYIYKKDFKEIKNETEEVVEFNEEKYLNIDNELFY